MNINEEGCQKTVEHCLDLLKAIDEGVRVADNNKADAISPNGLKKLKKYVLFISLI